MVNIICFTKLKKMYKINDEIEGIGQESIIYTPV